MQALIELLRQGKVLTTHDIQQAVEELLDTELPESEKAEFLSLLHRRGETPAEIAAFVEALLAYARCPSLPPRELGSPPLIDVCGTGGDKAGLFNVSTAVMFVVAACGAWVVKHGNRGITSRSGGADVLEALGVPLDIPAERAGEFLEKHGFVFLFAPQYHPAFKAIVPVRKALAERGETSVFNILGPLLNPARPEYQIAGVFAAPLLPTYAEVFRLLGRKRAWAVHGTLAEGAPVDELSPNGATTVYCTEEQKIFRFEIAATDLLPVLPASESLRGGSPQENADLLRSILRGENRGGCHEMVALNAGAALTVCGICPELKHGIARAKQALHDGSAWEVLCRASGKS